MGEDMDLDTVRYFLAVVDAGSLSRAAGTLRVSQPALSRHMRRLEDELGAPLLYRHGRGVVLTPAGRAFLDNARVIEQALESTAREIDSLRTKFAGSAVIGMPTSVGRKLTMPLARHFAAHYPTVKLHIREAFSGDILEWLRIGRIDIGILYSVTGAQGLLVQPVVEEQLALFSPSAWEYPSAATVPFAAAAALPLVLPGQPHTLRVELERIAEAADVSLDVRFEVDALHSMIEMVRQGLGHALLPVSALPRPQDRDGLLMRRIVEPEVRRVLHVASGAQRPGAVPLRQLSRLVQDQLLTLSGADSWQPAARRA